MPCSARKSVRFSLIFLVSVVTSTLPSFATQSFISPRRSSICPVTGRTSMGGSTSPVGRMTCSATLSAISSSYLPGVAETYTT